MNHAGIRSALSRIAWAYLLIHLHFRLNNLDVLPDWAGYLLIFSAIGLLAGELRDLPLLRPFCILLGAVSGVDWLSFLLTGAEFTGRFFLLSALITCVALYFHFQLLTDLAALADRRSGEGGRSPLGRRLRLCRNADAVFRAGVRSPRAFRANKGPCRQTGGTAPLCSYSCSIWLLTRWMIISRATAFLPPSGTMRSA